MSPLRPLKERLSLPQQRRRMDRWRKRTDRLLFAMEHPDIAPGVRTALEEKGLLYPQTHRQKLRTFWISWALRALGLWINVRDAARRSATGFATTTGASLRELRNALVDEWKAGLAFALFCVLVIVLFCFG